MGIAFNYFTIDVNGIQYAVKPDGISFGDAETEDIVINGGSDGTITTIQLKKRTVTLTIEGVTDADISNLQDKRDNNILDLINRRAATEDLQFGGFLVEQALITDLTPSAPKFVDGIAIFESLEVVYTSQVFV